jgi:hypothetical protein
MDKAVVVLLFSTLALADTSAPAERGKARVVATLERTVCFGSCPAYKLTVYSDGQVLWEGASYVKKKGKASATLTAGELSLLKAAFSDAGYFDLPDTAACYEATDNPWATTSYDDGTRHRTLRHYYGCRSKPEAATLGALERRIDQIVNSDRWIQ